jgi:hypothetical protein
VLIFILQVLRAVLDGSFKPPRSVLTPGYGGGGVACNEHNNLNGNISASINAINLCNLAKLWSYIGISLEIYWYYIGNTTNVFLSLFHAAVQHEMKLAIAGY